MAARLQIQRLINGARGIRHRTPVHHMASDIPLHFFLSFGEKHAVCAQKVEETHLGGRNVRFLNSRVHRAQVLMKLYYLDHDSGSAADQLFHSTKVLFPLRGENVTGILLICAL